MIAADTTWTCHVCGRIRPDDKIAVQKNDRSAEKGLAPGVWIENVRYCNDRPECAAGAKDYRHA